MGLKSSIITLLRRLYHMKNPSPASIKPPKKQVVLAFWPSLNREVESKWTGDKWLRFNELGNAWEVIITGPTHWRDKPVASSE